MPHYGRVPAVGTNDRFINGLAKLARNALAWPDERARCGGPDGERVCPGGFQACGHGDAP